MDTERSPKLGDRDHKEKEALVIQSHSPAAGLARALKQSLLSGVEWGRQKRPAK